MQKTAIIIDDSEISRFAIRKLLEEMNICIVGETFNKIEAINIIISSHATITILDCHLPDCTGIDIFNSTHKKTPNTKYLFVTSEKYLPNIFDAGNFEIINILLKQNFKNFGVAVEKVLNGNTYIDETVSRIMMQYHRMFFQLNNNEKFIIKLFMQKKRVNEIAELTNYSDRTIKRKKAKIISKIGRKIFDEICNL